MSPLEGLERLLVGVSKFTLVAVLACGGCSDSEPEQSADVSDVSSDADDGDVAPIECPESALITFEPTGVGLWSGCPDTVAELLPRVRIGGAWLGAGAHGDCAADGESVVCPAGSAGTVSVSQLEPDTFVVQFEASESVEVEAIELGGRARARGATGWLSSGFQSWSQSGVVAIGQPPSESALETALEVRGDPEVIRSGHELSWFYTAIGGGPTGIVAGALSAEIFRPWLQVSDATGGDLSLRLVAGGTGESVAVAAGETVTGPTWFIALGAEPERLLADYGGRLPAGPSADAEAGWNSWYELWDDVDETAVRANAPMAAEILESLVAENAPAPRIVIDDGWQMLWGEWSPNEKFPAGLDGLAADLKADGYEVGVWLAPFLVDADSQLVADHPDWFVADAVYNHTFNGPMRVLDVTNPEVDNHLADVVETIVGWGFDFLKIDFLFAGAYEGARFDDVTGMQAFHRGMRIIRDAAGDDVVLLAVAAPPVAVFPYVESWRLGWDIALEAFGPSWPFVQSQARSLAVRWPLCQAVLCDADPVLLRGLPQNEVEVGAWVVALSGGGLFLSDDLRTLDEDRRGWGLDQDRVALAISGTAARPEQLFADQPPNRLANAFADQLTGAATHVVPPVWLTADGARVAINFGDEVIDVEGLAVPARSALPLDP